jgi:hypothetical protein
MRTCDVQRRSSAGLRSAAAEQASRVAQARLEAGLIAGDPDGEITIAWIIAQQVMSFYQQSDSAQPRAAATELITALRRCPIGELARLGRTLHAWRYEIRVHPKQADVSNGPTENLNLKIKNTKRIALCTASALNYGLNRRRRSGMNTSSLDQEVSKIIATPHLDLACGFTAQDTRCVHAAKRAAEYCRSALSSACRTGRAGGEGPARWHSPQKG